MAQGSKVPLVIGIVVVIGAIVGGVLIWKTQSEKQAQIAKATQGNAAAYEIAGEPCPQSTHDGLIAAHLEPRYTADFNSVTFARRFGSSDCAMVSKIGKKAYPVCQFTSPGGLEITTKKGVFAFAPGLGRQATVQVVDGVAACVLASKITNRSIEVK